MNIKFSIVTTTFNSSKTLEDTILSVINQDYPNFEYIIIDGGSTDSTLDIVNKYLENIICISEPDNGIYDAMNKGLLKASGDYLIFLGSDDCFIDIHVLNRVSSYITDLNSVYYGNVYRSHHKDYYCGKYNRFKLAVKNICHQSIFYPKCVYKKFKYSLVYRLYADYVMNMLLFSKFKYKYIPITTCYYNETGLSSNNIDTVFVQNRKQLVSDYLGYIPYLYSECYHFISKFVKRLIGRK